MFPLFLKDLVVQLRAFGHVDMLHGTKRAAHPFSHNEVWLVLVDVLFATSSTVWSKDVEAVFDRDWRKNLPVLGVLFKGNGGDEHRPGTNFQDRADPAHS